MVLHQFDIDLSLQIIDGISERIDIPIINQLMMNIDWLGEYINLGILDAGVVSPIKINS